MLEIPDLLNAEPRRTIDWTATDNAIVFAFAGSSSGGLFAEALATAELPKTTFDARCFAHDLFVADFVRSCFSIERRGRPVLLSLAHLTRVLCSPPSSPETLEFRRKITAELLESRDLRAELARAYDDLCRFRALLEAGDLADRHDPNRRQLQLLGAFHELVNRLAEGFTTSKSGLFRLGEFARRIRASEPFSALSDLLRYDERLATLNFKVAIGADGRVRKLELVSVAENDENQFTHSPFRRWVAKFELFARGYRFGEGEVMARLLDAVFDGIRGELPAFVQLLGDLEFYLGALGFAETARAKGLEVAMPSFDDARGRILTGLFNPLLLGTGTIPVPCSLDTDRSDTTILITGPNSGGKTRLLQSLGLTQLLAQSGLFVPAREANLRLTPGLLVSLIQETRVDQSEGRLGVELLRIRALFEELPPKAMVVLDELCSGTNPSEGEEIFELVLRSLDLLDPQAFITTHFLSFASRLEKEPSFARLRFLQVELGPGDEPTYQFTDGVAKTSLAGQAAARLGVTGEKLLALIERKVRAQGAGT